MKHTPGPWLIRKTDRFGYPAVDIECANNNLRSLLATCNGMSLCPEHGGTIEANARLIAVAPEMFALLRAYLRASADNACLNQDDETRALLSKVDSNDD